MDPTFSTFICKQQSLANTCQNLVTIGQATSKIIRQKK